MKKDKKSDLTKTKKHFEELGQPFVEEIDEYGFTFLKMGERQFSVSFYFDSDGKYSGIFEASHQVGY